MEKKSILIKALISAVGITFVVNIPSISIWPFILFCLLVYIYSHIEIKNMYINAVALIYSLFLAMGRIDFIREKGLGIGSLRLLIIIAGSYWLMQWGVGRIFLFYDKMIKNSSSKIVIPHIGMISFIILFICSFPKWLSEYPGVMTPDSIWQAQQVLGIAPLNSHHPIIHTLWIKLWYEIGYTLGFRDSIAIWGFVSFVQMILQCLILSILVKYLYDKTKNVVIIILAIAFYGLVPFNTSYSVTLWKDIIHAWTAALYLIMLDYYLKNNNSRIGWKQIYCTIMLLVLGVAFCLFRNNGYYAMILWAMMIFVFLFKKKNFPHAWLILIAVMVIIISTVIKGPVYSNLNVIKGGYGENLSIPIQQIAYVITNGRELRSDERELLEKVVDIEEIPSKYTSWLSDPIKNMCNVNSEYFMQHRSDYLKLWVKIGVRYPIDYLTAYIKQTYGYYYPDTSYWVYAEGITQNEMEIEEKPILHIDMAEKIKNFGGDTWGEGLRCGAQIPLYGSFFNVGVYTWILLCMMSYVLYAKKGNLFIQYLLLFCIFITLMIATPVYAEFRYYYSVVICLPWLLFAPMAKD